MPTVLLPTAYKVTREALLAQAPLIALVSTRIHWAIPSTPVWPLLVLSVVDDLEDGNYSSAARVQVSCWGAGPTTTDLANCDILANTVRSVSRDLVGAWTDGDIAQAIPGPKIPAPDPQTGRVRIIIDLLLTLYP